MNEVVRLFFLHFFFSVVSNQLDTRDTMLHINFWAQIHWKILGRQEESNPPDSGIVEINAIHYTISAARRY